MGVANLDYIRDKYVQPIQLDELPYHNVSVCTPLYNSMPFIKKYLRHVLNYDWPREHTSLMFTVQGNDGTLAYMKRFKKKYEKEYRRIKVKKTKQALGIELPHVYNVVRCRRLLTEWSKPDEYVFFNDHDNFNPPVSIKRLMVALEYGADIAGGVYLFLNRNQWHEEPHLGFTAFFIHDKKMHHYSINSSGFKGVLPTEMFGKMIWCDGVAMGGSLVKREVLDNINFFVPYGTTMTDDTAFCLKAREQGYHVIADFGLILQHWGYNITLKHREGQNVTDISVERTQEMINRRDKMRREGAYDHPSEDAGLNEALTRYLDINKIQQQQINKTHTPFLHETDEV